MAHAVFLGCPVLCLTHSQILLVEIPCFWLALHQTIKLTIHREKKNPPRGISFFPLLLMAILFNIPCVPLKEQQGKFQLKNEKNKKHSQGFAMFYCCDTFFTVKSMQ